MIERCTPVTAASLQSEFPRFIAYLDSCDYAQNSIEGYRADVGALLEFLDRGSRELSEESLLQYKQQMIGRLKPSSVNRNIAAINKFLGFLSLETYTLKPVSFGREPAVHNELTHWEFVKLIMSASVLRRDRMALIILTLATTGIQISELSYITVQAVHYGKAVIPGKSKSREVAIQKDLQHELQLYCEESGIMSGVVFRGSNGKPINRSYVASSCKKLAEKCGIDPAKVSPRGLRRYYVSCFLNNGDVSALSDALGYTSTGTARNHLMRELESKRQQGEESCITAMVAMLRHDVKHNMRRMPM